MREKLEHSGGTGRSYYEVEEEHGDFIICQWMENGRPEDYDVYRLNGRDASGAWVRRSDGREYYYIYTMPHTLGAARLVIESKGGSLVKQSNPNEFSPF